MTGAWTGQGHRPIRLSGRAVKQDELEGMPQHRTIPAAPFLQRTPERAELVHKLLRIAASSGIPVDRIVQDFASDPHELGPSILNKAQQICEHIKPTRNPMETF